MVWIGTKPKFTDPVSVRGSQDHWSHELGVSRVALLPHAPSAYISSTTSPLLCFFTSHLRLQSILLFSFAMGTLNRPNPYIAQYRSPLFRLPRELRDNIYAYYAHVEDGYHHNVDTGKLSPANREPIDLDLIYSCRAVADEMEGVAFRLNTVTFKAGEIDDDTGFYGLHSRGGRLEDVLDAVSKTRRRMLLYVAACVTPQILQDAMAFYGEGGRRLVEAFKVTQSGDFRHPPRCGDEWDLVDNWHAINLVDPSTQYRDGLRYILECCSADTRFKGLALQAFDVVSDHREVPWAVSAIPAALQHAVHWQPGPWEIPTEAQLATLENAFYPPDHGINSHGIDIYQ